MVNFKDPYSLVILGNLLIGLQYLFFIYLYVMTSRLSTLTGKFMKQFTNLHREHFGKDSLPPNMGYPDTGNGWYSKKLPYADWLKFNSA